MRHILYPLDWLLSFCATLIRLGAGGGAKTQPVQDEPLILYEFENCPYCRFAREAISQAGVLVDIRPCPKNGKRFRPEVKRLGGKAMFPYLVDPNTGTAMYESADIARHVRETYAPDTTPLLHHLGPLGIVLSIPVMWLRLARGMIARPAEAPEQPLELHATEHTPGARLIREMLCTRELRYLWTSLSDTGRPCLHDPNTGETRTGSLNILVYLDATYGG